LGEEGVGFLKEIGRVAGGGENQGVGLGMELIENEEIDGFGSVAEKEGRDSVVVNVFFLPVRGRVLQGGGVDETGDGAAVLLPSLDEAVPGFSRRSLAAESTESDHQENRNESQKNEMSGNFGCECDHCQNSGHGNHEEKTASPGLSPEMSCAAEELIGGEGISAVGTGVPDDLFEQFVVEFDGSGKVIFLRIKEEGVGA